MNQESQNLAKKSQKKPKKGQKEEINPKHKPDLIKEVQLEGYTPKSTENHVKFSVIYNGKPSVVSILPHKVEEKIKFWNENSIKFFKLNK